MQMKSRKVMRHGLATIVMLALATILAVSFATRVLLAVIASSAV